MSSRSQGRKRRNWKGRNESGTFLAIPHAVMDSQAWRLCRGTAIKLLFDIARQYRGNNNGDLCASEGLVPGYASETRARALRELCHYGLLIKTRQGGLHQSCLYALSWRPIDDCKGKLEVAATVAAPGDWKGPKLQFSPPKRERGASSVSLAA